MPSLPAPLLLALVVGLAFTIEAAMGFGATIVTVALGSLFLATAEILPAFVPLNLVLSGYLVVRGSRFVEGRLLLLEVLPAMAVGMPLGILAFRHLDEVTLRLALGVFVLVVSALELASKAGARALAKPLAFGLLGLGGVIHGAFGAGGPLVVYVLGRKLSHDKAAFRATLSALWLVLNVVLVASYAQAGQLSASTGLVTLSLSVPLAVGLGLGELVHRAVPAHRFRPLVFGLLLVVGLVLVARSAPHLFF
ncbi:MAG: sulfite exporter TauE/SafE family protein [Myxococcales bacterium]|nr:sulfite exporter TauE/SafE family protein [Myxococcales bacterium]